MSNKKKYRIGLTRTSFHSQEITVFAESREEAEKKAYEMVHSEEGNWNWEGENYNINPLRSCEINEEEEGE